MTDINQGIEPNRTMPTPFSHLATLHRLLQADDLPAATRTALTAEQSAYLLGSVAPDARIDAPDSRAATHFYTYTEPITQAPWRVMLSRYPSLQKPESAAQRAFVGGYVAHLAMDEVWTKQMLGPHFAFGEWGESRQQRFYLLHLLLSHMDERDLADLPPDVPKVLHAARPGDWLPFMPLAVLAGWQQLIDRQLRPGGHSRTLEIFGKRVGHSAAEMRQQLDDTAWMQRQLWDHVPPSVLADIEAHMRDHAHESLLAYWQLSEPAS